MESTVVLKDKTVKVTKEADELAESLVGLVKSGKQALADGFQAGQDVPKVLSDNLMQMMTGLEGMDKLDDEAEQQLAAFIRAWSLAGVEIAELFFKKKEA